MNKFLLSTLIIISLAACQNDNTSSGTETGSTTGTINFAQFYVRYLEGERQVKAHTSFYEGDTVRTARPVTVAGGVQFQGNNMELKELTTAKRYLYNGTGDYPDAGYSFQYKDAAGNTQQHTLQLAPIKGFSVKPSGGDGGMTLTLEGAAFEPEETLVMLFSDDRNQTYSDETKVPYNTNEIAIPSRLTGRLSSGKKNLYLVKKKTVKSMQGNIEVTSSIEYYTKSIDVQLTN